MAHNPPHILVTAGPTREKIDKVRDWGNIFSGKTGLDLALAFLKLGNVTLLTSNLQHADQYDGYSGAAGRHGNETVSTPAPHRAHLEERNADPIDVVAMTAAIADYKPTATHKLLHRSTTPDGNETWTVQNVSAPKVKSTHDEIAVAATATEKLIDKFRTQWNYRNLLIKFKLEVDITEDELIKVASASRLTSRADLIVANTLAMTQPESGTPSGAYLIDNNGATRFPRAVLAESILEWTKAHLAQK